MIVWLLQTLAAAKKGAGHGNLNNRMQRTYKNKNWTHNKAMRINYTRRMPYDDLYSCVPPEKGVTLRLYRRGTTNVSPWEIYHFGNSWRTDHHQVVLPVATISTNQSIRIRSRKNRSIWKKLDHNLRVRYTNQINGNMIIPSPWNSTT